MRIAIIDTNLAAMKLLKINLPDVYDGFRILRFSEPCTHSPPATAGT